VGSLLASTVVLPSVHESWVKVFSDIVTEKTRWWTPDRNEVG
jgi:hypothetical protein